MTEYDTIAYIMNPVTMMQNSISLYIHIPWCIQKCPYCDFNSHKLSTDVNEITYVNALINDLETDLRHFKVTELKTIFIGGGTPSLFSANALDHLFKKIRTLIPFHPEIEITLEANPGTVEQERFRDYYAIGINRISLGIQSFNLKHLKTLGRIHDDKEAHNAIECIHKAGFDNFNLDIMYGLPDQTVDEALNDLSTALQKKPPHLSWYQLTIEPNTVFYKTKPRLPNEDFIALIEQEGYKLLQDNHYNRYEISAFSKHGKTSKHNLNYWLFGDYIGIGAGAHGKYTDTETQKIFRTRKHRQPKDYLHEEKLFLAEISEVDTRDRIFEFMLNTTRLECPIPYSLFQNTTFLMPSALEPYLKKAETQGLIKLDEQHWTVTKLGRQYTNDLQALFLPDNPW